jgi:hypothetical protein
MSKNPKFENYWRVMRRKFRFKGCLHPDIKKCAGKIISAHSIQKERYLRNIAEDGNVMMLRDNGDGVPNYVAVGLKTGRKLWENTFMKLLARAVTI